MPMNPNKRRPQRDNGLSLRISGEALLTLLAILIEIANILQALTHLLR
jgi:hypothetical protein